jgi:hypothetical protein
MRDEQIASVIAERGLEELYIRELVASMGFDPGEGWTTVMIEALESATYVQRRRAALRVIGAPEENGEANPGE